MTSADTRSEEAGSSEFPGLTADLIPRAQLAKQLNVCPHTLRDWERRGRGPPTIRVGKRVYYRAEAVRRWLLDQETRATTT